MFVKTVHAQVLDYTPVAIEAIGKLVGGDSGGIEVKTLGNIVYIPGPLHHRQQMEKKYMHSWVLKSFRAVLSVEYV